VTVGSLFAGIGGFDLAASRVWGWDCVKWQVEIDPFACRVLAKHWPEVPRFGDIRELTGGELEPVELVCGGFPCQPVSLAGKRMGEADDRWLWPEMRRVVSLLKPAWVVGENVPGLLGMGLDQVCADLEALGYEVWPLGIPAVAVGAPHLRERLWIVAYRETVQRPPIERSEPNGTLPRDGAMADTGCLGSERRRNVGKLAGPQGAREGQGSERQRLRDASRGSSPALSVPDILNAHNRGPGASAVPQRQPRETDLRGSKRGWWWVEPGVGRVAHGIPARVDRLRGLGNAIVPQVAEVLFRLIDAAEAAQ
jgi:DNA (cytosine-5)-methyltransferase 1